MTRAEFMRRMMAAATLGTVSFTAAPPKSTVPLPDDGEWHHVAIYFDGREVSRQLRG
jgi:hypothetical protein